MKMEPSVNFAVIKICAPAVDAIWSCKKDMGCWFDFIRNQSTNAFWVPFSFSAAASSSSMSLSGVGWEDGDWSVGWWPRGCWASTFLAPSWWAVLPLNLASGYLASRRLLCFLRCFPGCFTPLLSGFCRHRYSVYRSSRYNSSKLKDARHNWPLHYVDRFNVDVEVDVLEMEREKTSPARLDPLANYKTKTQ